MKDEKEIFGRSVGCVKSAQTHQASLLIPVRPRGLDAPCRRHARWVVATVLVSSFILHPSSLLLADGGTFRATQRLGDFRVSVFTAPTSLRIGTVDVSVLFQDWTTGIVRTDVPVTIVLRSLEGPAPELSVAATNEAATNKFFRAAKFQVNEPGRWRVEVRVGPFPVVETRFLGETGFLQPTTDNGQRTTFDIDVAAGMPGSWDLGLWISWPFGVVVLFGVHQLLVRRRVPATPRIKRI